jgi:hypothetical protein
MNGHSKAGRVGRAPFPSAKTLIGARARMVERYGRAAFEIASPGSSATARSMVRARLRLPG